MHFSLWRVFLRVIFLLLVVCFIFRWSLLKFHLNLFCLRQMMAIYSFLRCFYFFPLKFSWFNCLVPFLPIFVHFCPRALNLWSRFDVCTRHLTLVYGYLILIRAWSYGFVCVCFLEGEFSLGEMLPSFVFMFSSQSSFVLVCVLLCLCWFRALLCPYSGVQPL